MKKIFLLLIAAISFLGCAPNHTLKEVLHDPALLMPQEAQDNGTTPLKSADQWIQKHLW